MNMNKIKSSLIYIIMTALLFGTMEVALKIAGSQFNAIQLTFLRFMIGGLVLLPFAAYDLKKRKYSLTFGDWCYLLLLGIVCICISMSLFQIGVMQTNASLAAIIISINPIFTMIFAHYLINEKFTKRKAVVLLLELIGLIIVANPFELLKGNKFNGILTVLVASISFGLYTAIGKKRVSKIGGIVQNSFSFILGSILLLVILLIFHIPVTEGIKPDNILLVLYLGIFVTGIGYYCYLKAIDISGPSTASIAFFIKPIFAVFLSLIILGEPITINVIIGMLFILAGFILNMIKK